MVPIEEVQAGGGGVAGALARPALAVLSGAWRAAWHARRALYATGLRRRVRLAVPVVSIGNLVAGGTGKTPFTAWLAGLLVARGHRPGVLARGYGPRAALSPLSDEGAVRAVLLPPGVPQVEDPDRVRGAARLLAAHPATSVLLLDDGFQHWRVRRDLDVVLVDATRPFGPSAPGPAGHLLPRGLLREPPAALARAGIVVLTRAERVAPARLAEVRALVARRTRAPVATTRTRPAALEVDGRPVPLSTLAGRRVAVLCGIGNPHAFAAMLAEDLGADVALRRFLPDHAAPDAATWDAVRAAARAAGADWVVVTRKDAVKQAALPPGVAVLDVALDVVEGRDVLEASLP